MPAKFDIDIYDNRIFVLDLYWYDEGDNIIDISSYGAIFAVKEHFDDEEELIHINHTAGITMGTASGAIGIQVPKDLTGNLNIDEFVWELIIFPTPADPTSEPEHLAGGNGEYHKTVAKLEL